MKTIMLTKGKVALVDDRDYKSVSRYCWQATCKKIKGGAELWYAKRAVPKIEQAHPRPGYRPQIAMHRDILKLTNPKVEADHRNGDGLDNRRSNIRQSTRTQNLRNQRKTANKCSSIYKGVSWTTTEGKWKAHIAVNRRRKLLGSFDDQKDAALAYNEAAKKYFGEFALLNVLV